MANKKDFATSVVATAPSPADSGTSLVVQSGHGARFPAAPFYVTVHPPSEFPTLDNAEKILVTEKSTDTFTLDRAEGDTTAKSIEAGWRISNALFLDDIPDTFDDLTDGSTNKAFTGTEKTKLSGIETAADVTDAANVGSSIHGSSGKTTPVDADTVPLIDSGASNVLKKLTWANLKAAIKSYYDSVTATMTNKTLTNPLVNKILDTNGNSAMLFNATANAVNYAWFVNGATGSSVSMRANGSDTNIPFALFSKGSGQVQLRSDTGLILTGNSVASGVNYLNVTSSIAGASPFMSAVGSDTNLDLNLVPKGTGNVTANGVPVVSTTGTQTLTSKTLTSPVINTGVSGTAILDEDNMASDSNTKLATQQSIKAYVDTLSAQSSWQTWSLQNGWTNHASSYGGTNNYKKVGGIVFLRGLISSGTTASGTLILTLPSGYRPSMDLVFTVPAFGDQLAELRVGTNGTITVGDRDFQSGWTSMCVSFPVD